MDKKLLKKSFKIALIYTIIALLIGILFSESIILLLFPVFIYTIYAVGMSFQQMNGIIWEILLGLIGASVNLFVFTFIFYFIGKLFSRKRIQEN